MKTILLNVMHACALRYCKGIPRGIMLWDERLSYKQKADDLADMLYSQGYRIIKFSDAEDTVIKSELVTCDGE